MHFLRIAVTLGLGNNVYEGPIGIHQHHESGALAKTVGKSSLFEEKIIRNIASGEENQKIMEVDPGGRKENEWGSHL